MGIVIKTLVPVKRVVDYKVKVRVKADLFAALPELAKAL